MLFTAPGVVDVRPQPIPEPARGQVLVRTRCTLISAGTELTLLQGSASGDCWRDLTRYPRTSGYSNVGRVEAVGPGEDPAWVGRRVHNHGSHQRFTLSPLDRVTPLPDGVDECEATFATLAKVAMNGLRRVALTWGERVGVVGLGIVGQLATRLCLGAGAARVVAMEVNASRLGRLPESPRLIPVHGDIRDEATPALRAACAGGLDVVIEATGEPTVLAAAPRLLRPQGRLLLLSSPRGASTFDFHDLCNRPSLSIVGAHGFSHPPEGCGPDLWTSRRHGELFLDLLRAGQISTRELITDRFPAHEAARGYRRLLESSGDTLGVILEW